MSEMINERNDPSGNGNDLLSSLLDANNGEDSEKLTESELMGKLSLTCFTMIFIGNIYRKHFHLSSCRPWSKSMGLNPR